MRTFSVVSQCILGRFTSCLALWAQHDHSYKDSQETEQQQPQSHPTMHAAYLT